MDVNLVVQLKVLEIDRLESRRKMVIYFGDVIVNVFLMIFKKIKMMIFENIGLGLIYFFEEELYISAVWFELKEMDLEIGEKMFEQFFLGIVYVLQYIVFVYVMCD